MKFVIIGINGKMGKEIKSLIINSNDSFVAGIDIEQDVTNKVFTSISDIKEKFDSVIDFSTATCRKEIINFCFNNNITYGCFSTNISKEDKELITDLSHKVPVLICDNASAGVNLMKKITQLVADYTERADLILTEYHHKHKIDAPSGTAKSLINILNNKNKQCEVAYFRVGNEIGKHCLEIFLNDEKLTITHQAFSKKVFAIGALNLMHNLNKKSCGLFFNEVN